MGRAGPFRLLMGGGFVVAYDLTDREAVTTSTKRGDRFHFRRATDTIALCRVRRRAYVV